MATECKMLMFLRDAEDFSASLSIVSTTCAASEDKEDLAYAQLVEIIDKYIKDGSPFEINIECKTKVNITRMADKATFNKETLVSPRLLFVLASQRILPPPSTEITNPHGRSQS